MTIVALAPAKLNLGLEVLRRRDDGYHDIRTVMAAISIFDRISVTAGAATALSVDDPTLAGRDNLVLRAAERFAAVAQGVTPVIHLAKRIPTASGLGGGSSDAAATLLAVRAAFEVPISDGELQAFGAALGSDVPFFFHGGAAMVEGRGDRIDPLPPIRNLFAVVVSPRITIPAKTATLYRSLGPNDFTDGRLINSAPGDWTYAYLGNAFARPLYELVPSLGTLPGLMRAAGAQSVALSGAGPAHVALEPDHDRAHRLGSDLRAKLGGRATVQVSRFLAGGVLLAGATGPETAGGWARSNDGPDLTHVTAYP